MSHGARGLIFIMNERHENWRRTADQVAARAEPAPSPEQERERQGLTGRLAPVPGRLRHGQMQSRSQEQFPNGPS
jgi:hypothetical protein